LREYASALARDARDARCRAALYIRSAPVMPPRHVLSAQRDLTQRRVEAPLNRRRLPISACRAAAFPPTRSRCHYYFSLTPPSTILRYCFTPDAAAALFSSTAASRHCLR